MMFAARWLRATIAGLVLALLFGQPAMPADADMPALPQGGPFVLVVAGSDPAVIDSEAYADWEAYLAQFVESAPAELPIVTISPQRYRELVDTPSLSEEFATLFATGKGPALVYDGMVLEPEIYVIGQSYLGDGTVPAGAADYGVLPAELVAR